MKIFASCLCITTGLILGMPALAADYNGLLSPTSLGKTVSSLNKIYNLGLKKDAWGYYFNNDSADCRVVITANNNRASEIEISGNNEDCSFTAHSSGTDFTYGKTTVVDILNQAELSDIKFVPGCFNCPQRIELLDSLIVSRAKDSYYTRFDIEGYNRKYKEYMAEKLIGPISQDNYYIAIDELDEKLNNDSSAYNREDFKRKAIKTYDLQARPWTYAIALK